MIDTGRIVIEKTENSKLDTLDFENLKFGKEFADHMFIMEYANGAWQTPNITPFRNLDMNPATSVIHYGQSIFEGLKAYKNEAGEVFLFRPEENIKRFNISATRMCMPNVDEDMFKEALVQLIKIDASWIPTKADSALYIRPFMFGTDEYIGVKPSDTYKFIIFTCPVNQYYAGSVKVKIETEFSRSAPGGTGYAKAAGNYAGALYPAKLAQEQGFDQLVWTDPVEHKYIEESGTMNIIFVSGNKVITPVPSETILKGITRDSVLILASQWGYEIEERKIEVAEIISMLKDGTLTEAFGAGTAATVAPIRTINFEGVDYNLPDPTQFKLANKVLKEMDGIKRGVAEDINNWNERIF